MKRVVVTAGGAGIGHAIVTGFCDAGAAVHVADIDADAMRALAAEIPDVGTTVADVAEPHDVDRLFEEAFANLGGLDILVNCAGIAGPTGRVDTVDPGDWRRTVAVNLDGSFLCARRAVPALLAAGGGSIVNIASTAGLMGYPLRTPYAAAKWGVIGLTKSLAMELGGEGIRVNAICPGSVDGPRMDRVIAAEAAVRGTDETTVRDAYRRQNALKTFIPAEDIAGVVLFVCSDAGALITGQALSVDGHIESLSG